MNNNYENELELIKKEIGKNVSLNSIPDNFMQGFNKKDVQKKLRELGMSNLADKLEPMSEQMIEKMIKSNPQILKKAAEILNDRR